MESKILNNLTPPYRESANENVVEKPLSPVLNKKSFNRKSFLESKKNSEKRQVNVDESFSRMCEAVRKKNAQKNSEVQGKDVSRKQSSIPVPIKGASNYRSVPTTPSSMLEFETELLRNCARLCHNNEVVTEVLQAGADVKERPQYIIGDNLDMLYENKAFAAAVNSKTTIDDVESDEVIKRGAVGAYRSASDSSLMSSTCENLKSQLNYNLCTDDSSSTLEHEIREIEKFLEDKLEKGPAKTPVRQAINVSSNAASKIVQSCKVKERPKSRAEDLAGFTDEEIKAAEKNYMKYQKLLDELELKTFEKPPAKRTQHKKSKSEERKETLLPTSKKLKTDPKPAKPKTPPKKPAEPKPETPNLPNTITIPSNKDVQICIKSNRIKINIKSEGPDKTPETGGFKLASNKQLKINAKALEEAEKLHAADDEPHKPKTLLKSRPEFGRPSYLRDGARKSLQFSETPKDEPSFNFGGGFSLASGKNVTVSKEKLEQAAGILDVGDYDPSKAAHELIKDVVTSYDTALEKISTANLPDKGTPPLKKPLGVPWSKGRIIPKEKVELARQIFEAKPKPPSEKQWNVKSISGITKEKLERAQKLFDDLDAPRDAAEKIKPCTKFTLQNSTPIKMTVNSVAFTSTPKQKLTDLTNVNITPIRPPDNADRTAQYDRESTIVFRDGSCGDFSRMQTDIEKEYEQLKRRLAALEEKMVALERQRSLINHGENDHRRPKMGTLMKCKANPQDRVPLRKLFNSGEENVCYFNIDQNIFEVSPQNAQKVHFIVKVDEGEDCVVRTIDGAAVIPNSMNVVGVTEIDNAFRAMEGVDPKLVPDGWVRNHYRWIVWKLSSYERKFPQYFKGCLSIENIMQQMKYRYDKEIDRAQRPALRRILEKDDVAQKTMILCVSDIIQTTRNKFDLELTDGWYGLRTVIDPPLCQQVLKGTLKIGTKLVVYGAELTNCSEGCHPLEVNDSVRLKIGYNNTRRARWHTKLGYYRDSKPFPIRLATVHSEGGPIGLVKVYIARVYPLRYLETNPSSKIWRNARAEEKRARDFETERMQQLEKVKYRAAQDFERDNSRRSAPSFDYKGLVREVKKLTCAKTLYDLIQASDDPESLIEMLSPSQQKSVIEYKQSVTMQKQKEFSLKLNRQVEELKMAKRNVTATLRLLVLDTKDSTKYFHFTVWRPTEEHMQMLKEDTFFHLYNVTVGKFGELQSTNKTCFRPFDVANSNKFPRQLVPIAMTVDSYFKTMFNEFDTVGIVVQIAINDRFQELWLTDFVGRLLHVKVNDGPDTCLLLDNLKRGQVVAVCNLIMNNRRGEYGQAIANQYTTIVQYPQKKYLQKGLELFTQQLPEDVTKLLQDCDKKIESINESLERGLRPRQASNISEEDSLDENSASIPSKLTMTDIAMSLIDPDAYT